MEMNFWLQVLVIAVGAVGVIQYVKGYLPKAPSYVWAIALPIFCAGGALVATGLAWKAVLVGAFALAIAQIGYETLVQGIIAAIDAATGANIKMPPTASDPTKPAV